MAAGNIEINTAPPGPASQLVSSNLLLTLSEIWQNFVLQSCYCSSAMHSIIIVGILSGCDSDFEPWALAFNTHTNDALSSSQRKCSIFHNIKAVLVGFAYHFLKNAPKFLFDLSLIPLCVLAALAFLEYTHPHLLSIKCLTIWGAWLNFLSSVMLPFTLPWFAQHLNWRLYTSQSLRDLCGHCETLQPCSKMRAVWCCSPETQNTAEGGLNKNRG